MLPFSYFSLKNGVVEDLEKLKLFFHAGGVTLFKKEAGGKCVCLNVAVPVFQLK